MFIRCYKNLTNPIHNFTIFGERHSGTNFLQQIISNNLKVKLTWEFGGKHWIGNTDWSELSSNKTTLFIGIVRNIYDWIGGMYKKPHHIKIIGEKTYKQLLTSSFVAYHDPNSDKVIEEEVNYITQQPYSNIFECRLYKNLFLLHYMPFLVDNFIMIRYEDLILYPEEILRFVSDVFRIQRKKRDSIISKTQAAIGRNKKPYILPEDVIELINGSTCWSTENICGYSKK